MEKYEIEEVTLKPEDFEMEIGGARRLDVSNISSKCNFTITNVTAVKTNWGTRLDFLIKDEFDELILSDWNFTTKKKIKIKDLIGKKITIEPSKNPKKVLLNVLE